MGKPAVLIVLDGWGIAPANAVNAIATAPDRAFQRLRERYARTSTTVEAHGRAVGLMAGQMGDSNVGHLTIGAGRIIHQNLARIFDAIETGELAANPVLGQLMEKARGGRLHLLGLLSPGGVHSHQEHLAALLRICRDAGLSDIYLHVWLDGRDVPPKSAAGSLEYLANTLNTVGVGQVASVSGRYYAMDRDRRWERTERAYRAMVEGRGATARSAPEALMAAYAQGLGDEFVEPTVLVDETGRPVGPIAADDVVLVFNFRPDRVRQITRALFDPAFDHFDRPYPQVAAMAGMTRYDENFALPYLFGPSTVPNNLAEWLSGLGLTQLHVAETEKYAHVTFFFNGGTEEPYPGEDRVLIPSPKVATYDVAPAMSAVAIADTVVEDIARGGHDFILLNFANSDMVGHSGKLDATQEAVRVVDAQIDRIQKAVAAAGGTLFIVADHGNAEVMADADGQPHTNHTTNPVPFVMVTDEPSLAAKRLVAGGLRDVAPTILDAMGLPVPVEMTGQSLLRS